MNFGFRTGAKYYQMDDELKNSRLSVLVIMLTNLILILQPLLEAMLLFVMMW